MFLGKGLRIKGSTDLYHSMEIHKGDVEEFVKRWTTHTNLPDRANGELVK